MRPLIAGNWKMNGLALQIDQIEAIAASVKAKPPDADILICPPATLVARAAQAVAGRIAVGGQNCHTEIAGAFTGVEDDDMNVFCLGGNVIGAALALELVETFLSARFNGVERHLRRLGKLRSLETRGNPG